MVNARPEPIRVVCVLLVLPYWSEPMKPPNEPSTTLLMLETVVPPPSKNFTSSPPVGAVPPDQLALSDQLVVAVTPLVPLQILVAAFSGFGARTSTLSKKRLLREISKKAECLRGSGKGLLITP